MTRSISVYKSRFGTAPVKTTTVNDYLNAIQHGKWQDFVLNVRNGKAEKDDAPGVTVSALFSERRRAADIKEHSGIIGIDLDDQDNENLLDKREELAGDPFCYALHTSIRGYGLVWYVKIDGTKHKDAFAAIEKYLANKYQVIVDPSGKDVSRFRYISYDPELYINEKSKTWRKYIPKKERPNIPVSVNVYHNDDIQHILNQIKDRGANIAEDYASWLNISFALSSEFKEQGRDYFHLISSQSSKYDQKQCDKQFDIALRRNESGVTIATFFYYCKQAGIELKTQITEDILTVGKQRIKSSRNRKEALASTSEYFQDMKGIGEDRIKPILDKLENISDSAIKSEKLDDKTREMEIFLSQYKMKFNEVSRKIELNGKPIDDRDINSMYIKAMHAIDHNLSKAKLWDMIDSDLTPSYNPFHEFFKQHKTLKPEGRIQDVLNCFKYEKPDLLPDEITGDEQNADYLEVFLTRWLVSIISAMHGTYSLLTLVLVGGQGTGKTKFFRSLLPDELMPYYAESKLDAGKDDEILMTQKLIILDDEFGGKSKIEAKKFKDMSSKEWFNIRRPYGRVTEDIRRYAVLCGTSNDHEILNDTTGNRRLIPVNLISFDHKEFESIDKVELFMELYHLWKEIGDGWMLGKEEIEYLNKATSKNEQPTPEEEMLLKYFIPASGSEPNSIRMTNTDIRNVIEKHSNIRVYQKNLGLALKKLGFIKQKKKVNGNVKLCYTVICDTENTQKTSNEVDF